MCTTKTTITGQGYEVDIYETRPFIGGKVASFRDKDGNDIEMGLHVFFGEHDGGWRARSLARSGARASARLGEALSA